MELRYLEKTIKDTFLSDDFKVEVFYDTNIERNLVVRAWTQLSFNTIIEKPTITKIVGSFNDLLVNTESHKFHLEKHKVVESGLNEEIESLKLKIADLERYKTMYDLNYEMQHGKDIICVGVPQK